MNKVTNHNTVATRSGALAQTNQEAGEKLLKQFYLEILSFK